MCLVDESTTIKNHNAKRTKNIIKMSGSWQSIDES